MNNKLLNINNFIDEKTFRRITINKVKNTLNIGFRRSPNKKFESIILSLNNYIDYYINIKKDHIIKVNEGIFNLGNYNNFYSIKEILEQYYYWSLSISGSIPVKQVVKIINDNKLHNYNIAEISGQYGSTSQYNLDNTNIKHYDIFEIKPELCNFLRQRFSNYANVNIIEGDVLETLKNINIKYDVIFYDCTHNYDIDIKIVNELLKNINEKSIVIFHDYDMNDVKKMIDEFCKISNCIVYALESSVESDKIYKLK